MVRWGLGQYSSSGLRFSFSEVRFSSSPSFFARLRKKFMTAKQKLLQNHFFFSYFPPLLRDRPSSSGVFTKPMVKPQPPQTNCPALLPQHPAQAQPHLFHARKTAFYLAVAYGKPRTGHSHTGKALCAVVGTMGFVNTPDHEGRSRRRGGK